MSHVNSKMRDLESVIKGFNSETGISAQSSWQSLVVGLQTGDILHAEMTSDYMKRTQTLMVVQPAPKQRVRKMSGMLINKLL